MKDFQKITISVINEIPLNLSMCKKFYLDTCIWLNLFKKEGDETKGRPYWKLAKEFINKTIISNYKIFYSGFVFKEIMFNINNIKLFQEKFNFLRQKNKLFFIDSLNKDRNYARELEKKFNYEISFYDCLHVAICKRLNLILITRDKKLIEHGKKIVFVSKPEDLLF